MIVWAMNQSPNTLANIKKYNVVGFDTSMYRKQPFFLLRNNHCIYAVELNFNSGSLWKGPKRIYHAGASA